MILLESCIFFSFLFLVSFIVGLGGDNNHLTLPENKVSVKVASFIKTSSCNPNLSYIRLSSSRDKHVFNIYFLLSIFCIESPNSQFVLLRTKQ